MAKPATPATDEPSYSIRAVQRVCDLLDFIQANPGTLTLVQLSEAASLPKSSAFRYLETLEQRGYVHRGASGVYSVGVALRTERVDVIVDRARPYLVELRDQFEETVNIGRLDFNRVLYLDVVESQRSVRLSVRPGDRESIHSTALGKAVAAHLPERQVRGILHVSGMPRLTDATITSDEDYLAELEKVRTQGYAMDDGENERDGRCVAVSIPGLPVPMAISLSAPAMRFPREDVPRVARRLIEIAERLSGPLANDEPDSPPTSALD
ncbi:IclR family transcriptional regulator [Salinibacterium sp. M195]|uniref:IclR family transcriptional regulator n=1 Tax=Salinibacterium sp. M195 TaxID=2583374 RepID=UPI001C62CA83|nr:IclR family transcriptional regulator [Salinibacterium sp. M195]QYH35281.1 IclR family transcriptional regulator [Salinibacterium sp. M195]